MKSFTRIAWNIALTAMLLAGVLATAQQSKPNDTKSAAGSSAKAKSTVSLDAASKDAAKLTSGGSVQNNPAFQESNNQGSMPDHHGRAKSDVTLDATSKDAAKLSDAQSNPMYKEQKSEGTNPLYEKSDSTLKAQDPSTAGSQNGTPGVNDHYRPGNNKTSKASSTSNGNHKDVVEYKDGEDGTMHTRPASQK
jgi:hypothetical protein